MKEQIVAQIENYLHGYLSLSELSSWLLRNSQSILDSGDLEARHLMNAVDSALILLSEKLMTLAELEQELSTLISMQRTTFIELSCSSITTESSSVTEFIL